jgi:hypothetical protein
MLCLFRIGTGGNQLVLLEIQSVNPVIPDNVGVTRLGNSGRFKAD